MGIKRLLGLDRKTEIRIFEIHLYDLLDALEIKGDCTFASYDYKKKVFSVKVKN